MALGHKNYFRHSFFAINDPKIQKAIELLGLEGYACYFILLEILCQQCDVEGQKTIKIHPSTLRRAWGKQTKSCNKVLTKLQQSGLFVVTLSQHCYEFRLPNLPKYIGSYQKQNSNKIKGNKSKDTNSDELVSAEQSKNPSQPKKNLLPTDSNAASFDAHSKNKTASDAPDRDTKPKKKKSEKVNASTIEEVLEKIPKSNIERWNSVYEDSEWVSKTVRKCICWYFDHPSRKPRTLVGWIRKISGWLSRDQQNGKKTTSYTSSQPKTFSQIRMENNVQSYLNVKKKLSEKRNGNKDE